MECYIVIERVHAGLIYQSALEALESSHLHHSRCSKKGVWESVFEALSKDGDNAYHIINTTIVRAHQHRAGAKKSHDQQAIGRSAWG
ncbi:hypothetical protein Aasi_1516 [Candidatus Amoebophilus asiaticus 5a2]|uniref:Uncharacterized protein n=1 Tax=Amoebophilus asiaticus (strain 5a2) TaxID=452471 RepID=C3L4F8_AMOA5|nr:hypothetical protein Aasi_1516 [Candidatus Amoebophilus asiaticus 5a2]